MVEKDLYWHSTKSSFVDAIAYDHENNDLYVTLSHGSYVYNNVPRVVFEEFLLAGSKGKYFNANIKDVYPFITR